MSKNTNLTVRRAAKLPLSGVLIDILIDGVEIGSVKNGGEKNFEVQHGFHSISAQLATVKIPTLPIFFNAIPENPIEIDVEVGQGVLCKFRDSNILIQDVDLPLEALKNKLVILETLKENLESKNTKPGMSTGMAFVWLIFIFLFSGVCSWGFGMSTRPDVSMGMVGLFFGLLIFGGYFLFSSTNKVARENHITLIKNTIAQTKVYLDKKSPSSQSNSANEPIKTTAPEIELGTTQNLDTELRRIKKLLDDALITDDEYQSLRKKVMKSA